MKDLPSRWQSVPLAIVYQQTSKSGRIPEQRPREDLAAPRTSGPVVLSSWKEIASYVGRGVRTVQRWEKDLGFPVRRAHGWEHSPVVAHPDEVNEWLRKTFVRRPQRPTV